MTRFLFRLIIACWLSALFAPQVAAITGDETHEESCENGEQRQFEGRALLQVRKPIGIKTSLLGYEGIGAEQPLDEEGFIAVQNACCTVEMKDFIRRLIEKAGKGVCHEGALTGMALWYDCLGDNDFATLEKNIASDSKAVKGKCPWIADKVPDECLQMDDSCPTGEGGTLAPCNYETTTEAPPPPDGCSNFPVSYNKYNPKQLFVCGCDSNAFAEGVNFELAGETVAVTSSFNSGCSGECKESKCATVNHSPKITNAYVFGDAITLK